MIQEQIAQAVSNLDFWLETMRQPGGYGGPVAHWWQNRFQYTGPGLDWRYEGILIGYASLYKKTQSDLWYERLNRAALDLVEGQLPDGSYRASCFEINPRSLGTPHEAAATLGLLTAFPHLKDQTGALHAITSNLKNVVTKCFTNTKCDFRIVKRERIPNKLATLAQALIAYTKLSEEDIFIPHIRACLDEIVNHQVTIGKYRGAVHQYTPEIKGGDGRFFPYYNARCIPPLVSGAIFLDNKCYKQAADLILAFLDRTLCADRWPQVVYSNGKYAQWPAWVAGTADLCTAYLSVNAPIPPGVLQKLLSSQLPSGGFPTALGFDSQISQVAGGIDNYQDVIPVVGWNDKIFRLLANLLDATQVMPHPSVRETETKSSVGTLQLMYDETASEISFSKISGEKLYSWHKKEPWAKVFWYKIGKQ